MIVAISTYQGEKPLTVNLARWIAQLGGVKHHDCLLALEEGTSPDGIIEPLQQAFGTVWQIPVQKIELPAGRKWGDGTTDATVPNEAFSTVANYFYHRLKKPFLWLEPDAVPMPLSDGRIWLNEIEAEYVRCKKPFMGAYVDMPPHEPHMSGIGVYPWNISEHSWKMLVPGKIAWDYAAREDTIGKKKAHLTDLIQHVYRTPTEPEGYSFKSQKDLSKIGPRTVIFHRCKDGSLIHQLRLKVASLSPVEEQEEPMTEREKQMRARIEELELQLKQKGSDVPCPAIPVISNSDTTDTHLNADVKTASESNAAPTSKPEARPRKKRVLSPEHKAKLKAAVTARWAKHKKLTGAV